MAEDQQLLLFKVKQSCEVAEAESEECFQEEGVAGCVERCGEIKKERTEVSKGFSNMEIVGDLNKGNFSRW